MRTLAIATTGILVVALAGGVVLGQPTSQPVFTPGTVEVVGSVSITNVPTVEAQQAGDWEVSLSDPVELVMPTPGFLRVGESYAFSWPGSDAAQTYRVLQIAGNGWVAAAPATGGDSLWLNTSLVRSIALQ